MLWRRMDAILCLHVLQFRYSTHLPVKSESRVNSGEDTGTVLWGGTDVCTSSWRSYRDGVMRRYGCLYLFMEKIQGWCYEEVRMFVPLHGEDTRIVLWGGIVVHTSSWRRYMGLLWGGIDVHTSSWRRYMDTYGEVWMFVPLHIL